MSAPTAIVAGRRAAEALMVDTVTITAAVAASDRTFNEATSQYEDAAGTVVYQGKCRVKQAEAWPAEDDGPGRVSSVVRLELHIPTSVAGVAVDQVVELHDPVTFDDDGQLVDDPEATVDDDYVVGRTWRVASTFYQTFATAQRLVIEEVVT